MKLKIDLTDPRHIAAAAAFFNSLAGVVPDAVLSIAQKKALLSSEEDLKKGRAKRTKTAKIEASGDPDTTKGTVEEKITGAEGAHDEGEATLEMLQALVPKLTKVSKNVSLEASKNNTKVLRDKMLGLGAKRVSSMTSDKYQEFYDFIQKEFAETLTTLDNAGA